MITFLKVIKMFECAEIKNEIKFLKKEENNK